MSGYKSKLHVMLFITLLADASAISDTRLHALFNSKLEYLSNSLEYLDRVGINATVTLLGSEKNRSLETQTHVDCGDPGFRDVLLQLVNQFNHSAGKVQIPNFSSQSR